MRVLFVGLLCAILPNGEPLKKKEVEPVLTFGPEIAVVAGANLSLGELVEKGAYTAVHPLYLEYKGVRSPAKAGQMVKFVFVLGTASRDLDFTKGDAGPVLGEMGKHGFRTATLRGFLAFGAEHPDEQRAGPIFSVEPFMGMYAMPYLSGPAGGKERKLWLAGVPFIKKGQRILVQKGKEEVVDGI